MSARTIVIVILAFLVAGVVGMGACALFLGKTLTGPPKAADSWLSQVAAGEFDKAYENTTDEFKRQASKEQFKNFMTQLRMNEFKVAKWRSTNIKNSEAVIEGDVERKDGSSFKCKMHLSNGDKGWIVHGLSLDTGAPEGKIDPPSMDESMTLIRQTLSDAQAAILKDDFKAFHASVSQIWKAQATPEDIREQLKPFVEGKINFYSQPDVEIQAQEPIVDQDKRLILKGSYKEKEKTVTFDLKYANEEGGWKLMNIGVNVK